MKILNLLNILLGISLPLS